jgi:O-antigen ligase
VATRPLPLISSPGPIAGAGLLSALLVGVSMGRGVPLGIGLLIGLCYAPLVLLNLQVGLAVWITLVFVEYLPAVSIGPNAAAILIALAWVGTLGSRRAVAIDVLRRHSRLLGGILLLLLWCSLSLAWAASAQDGAADLWQWYVAAFLFVIALTTLVTPQHVRLVIAAFVVGAVLSVVIGFVNDALSSSTTAIDTATRTEGRLQGGGGDPNYLAAGLVPAIILAAGLGAGKRSPIVRWLLVVAIGILVAGVAATESRGGLIAAGVSAVAALVFAKGKRPHVLALIALVVGMGLAYFSTSPGRLDRITSFNGGGNGRSDIWRVGWRMTRAHPINGIGLNNFTLESGRYVRRPGALKFVALIAERPHVAHNSYLQLWAETGLVGLLLFLAVIYGALHAAILAARRFEATARPALAELSRAVLIAGIGALAASFFISNATDKRLWLILALGPILLGVASRPLQPEET